MGVKFLFGLVEQDHVLQIYPACISFFPLREMCCYAKSEMGYSKGIQSLSRQIYAIPIPYSAKVLTEYDYEHEYENEFE